MQVAEVDPLPEAAAKAVTEPAGDGEHPQSDRQLGESQSLLVSAAENDGKWMIAGNQTAKCTIRFSRVFFLPFHLRNQSVKQMEAEAV